MKRNLELLFIIPKDHPSFKEHGRQARILGKEGDCLLDVALANALAISTFCGGAMACKSCLVDVEQNDFDAPKEQERRILLELAAGTSSRLSCQVLLKRDATIHLRVEREDDAMILD